MLAPIYDEFGRWKKLLNREFAARELGRSLTNVAQ